jgi:hypothetical protein
MKINFKSALTFILGVTFSGSIIVAQEQTQNNQFLSEDQRTMLNNELQKRKEIREAFKATLTEDQRNMLTDPRMVKADRIKAFRASLSDQQVNMIKERQQTIKAAKLQFRATLTDQQKMQFKRIAAYRGTMDRAAFKRALWRYRLRRV